MRLTSSSYRIEMQRLRESWQWISASFFVYSLKERDLWTHVKVSHFFTLCFVAARLYRMVLYYIVPYL
jgi:hypothetical protein